MADTKQTKTIGEHHVASELARRGWAPALTRDGLERTDILAVHAEGPGRRQIEIQVKSAKGARPERIKWPLGNKSRIPSVHSQEYFVLVAIPHDLDLSLRSFIIPRSHLAAASWISHMDWLTDPSASPGKRNATVEGARLPLPVIESYEGRWEFLHVDEEVVPVLLPPAFRQLALDERVGLPEAHPWREGLPQW